MGDPLGGSTTAWEREDSGWDVDGTAPSSRDGEKQTSAKQSESSANKTWKLIE